MSEKISRKEYFRQYYLANKNNTKKSQERSTALKKRGRPKKIIPPFQIVKLTKPITISFD